MGCEGVDSEHVDSKNARQSACTMDQPTRLGTVDQQVRSCKADLSMHPCLGTVDQQVRSCKADLPMHPCLGTVDQQVRSCKADLPVHPCKADPPMHPYGMNRRRHPCTMDLSTDALHNNLKNLCTEDLQLRFGMLNACKLDHPNKPRVCTKGWYLHQHFCKQVGQHQLETKDHLTGKSGA